MEPEQDDHGEDLGAVAIVGMAGRFPGAAGLERFWENLRDGIESVSRFTREELAADGVDRALAEHPDYVPAKAVLDRAEWLDAPFFNLSPREAEITDPQQRLFLEHAWEALEDAGLDPSRFAGAVGVFAGSSLSSYLLSNLLGNPAVAAAGALELRIGNDRDFLATAVSYRLNLRGPSVNVATACSTSLVAVHLACQSLLNRECDAALAGGVSVQFPQRSGYLWQRGGITSVDGHCRAFDAEATGTVGGEGVGVVVLKRLDDALAAGDTIRAVVRGSAINNDGGLKVGFTAPGVSGQAEVVTEAQALAGVDPATVTYVETHGSGTPLGDSVEIRALNRAFGPAGEKHCAVGSVKTNIGHLDAAAGIAGLIKTVLALEHRLLPPSLHFKTPHPELEIDAGPFYVNAALRPWDGRGGPRRAGVSSFGIGGTNAHAVLEEAPTAEPSGPEPPWSLLVLSAATPTALDAAAGRLGAHLAEHPEQCLSDAAWTTQTGRQAFPYRSALACRGREDAAAALLDRDPRRLLHGIARAERPVAFLFSGLGDHYPGMGAGLYRHHAGYRREIDRCAEILRPLLGEDLRQLLGAEAAPLEPSPGPDLRRMLGRSTAAAGASPLDRTGLLHPAVFVLEYALAKLWEGLGVRPRALLGYSLGELTAACLAGIFSLDDALRLVVERARLLETLPAGAMLAVPLGEEEAAGLLGDGLSLAAINGPGVSVLSGAAAPIAALEERLRERGLPSRRLPVAHALHSAEMEPLLAPWARLLEGVPLRPPTVPLVTGVTGSWITPEEATAPEHWVRHLRQTVRFAQGVATLGEDPALAFLEIGPGQGLTTLALQLAAGPEDRLAVPSLRAGYETQDDLAFFLTSLGRLWTAGVAVSWPRLHAGAKRRKVRLPTYPFERRPYRIERAGAPAVAAAAQEPGPAALHPRPALPSLWVAPRTALEETVAGIWRDALRLESIGVHDSFFHLGGHSLLASQVVLRLEQATGVELPLRALLERPTIAEVAATVERLREGGEALDGGEPDLLREAVLDPAIRATDAGLATDDPEAVLLTGATGFLGAFLLRDLLRETPATVLCLARAGGAGEAMERICRNLVSYGLWEAGFEERIVAVPGDLGQPLWGLSAAAFEALGESVGAIYHAGARVSFTYPYAALAPVNVQGTHEALRLAATGQVKPLHLVSTIAAFAPGSFTPGGIGREDVPLEATAGLFGGYGQSKWVAEKLAVAARERGLATTIYRPGAIGGDSATGRGNPKDLIWAFLEECLHLGAAPALDAPFEAAPVDWVSRAIVTLSRRPESAGKAFHLFNPHPVPWTDVFARARERGHALRELSLAAWLDELRRSVRENPDGHPMAPFWPLFAAESGETPFAGSFRFDDRNTREGLAGTAVVCPPAAGLLDVWLTFLSSARRSR